MHYSENMKIYFVFITPVVFPPPGGVFDFQLMYLVKYDLGVLTKKFKYHCSMLYCKNPVMIKRENKHMIHALLFRYSL